MGVPGNIVLLLEPTSLSETVEMGNGSRPVETAEPDPLLASQETQVKLNTTTSRSITLKSRTTGPTGLLSTLKVWALRLAIPSLVLNLILIILLITQSAKKSEPCPAGAASPVAACPDGWVGYLGKCYYFSQAEGNWTYSQSHCSSLNASLVVIDTQQEMDFMMRYKDHSDYWIGLWREPDQPWKWANGTKFNNWFPIVGGEKCAFLNHKDIASSSCSREGCWICSKPAEKPEGRANCLQSAELQF